MPLFGKFKTFYSMSDKIAPVLPGAMMIDRVLGEIQRGLIAGLPWLDACYGRAQRLVRNIEGRRVIYPAVYAGAGNDYMNVEPDGHKGNFGFFIADDPEGVDWTPGGFNQFSAPVSLVVWFDLRRVFGEGENRNTELLKSQVLGILNGRTGWHLATGERLTINRVYEQAGNIYRGFSLDEVDNQFLMHPFGGFRFEGTLTFNEPCV